MVQALSPPRPNTSGPDSFTSGSNSSSQVDVIDSTRPESTGTGQSSPNAPQSPSAARRESKHPVARPSKATISYFMCLPNRQSACHVAYIFRTSAILLPLLDDDDRRLPQAHPVLRNPPEAWGQDRSIRRL